MRERVGVRLIAAFFTAGAAVSSMAAVALFWSGGPLDAIWQLNPRAHEGFTQLGRWAVVLMAVVCVACGFAAWGLWRGTTWGRRFAAGILVVNLVGDAGTAVFGGQPGAAIGVPIAAVLVWYLRCAPLKPARFGNR
jgi:hypothetical protein